MAVIEVNEMDDDEGSWEKDKRDFVRKFQVLCDRREDAAAVIFPHPDLPQYLDPYYRDEFENWTSSLCRAAKAKRMDNKGRAIEDGGAGWLWEITYNYSSKGEDDKGEENPLLKPVKIKVRTNRFEKPIEVDLEDVMILNSATMPFDPPVTKDDARPTVTIMRNVPYFDLQILEDYKNATNEDAFLGRPQYFWKVSDLSADMAWWDDHGILVQYWEVEMEIEGNPDLWEPVSILDRGRYEFGSDSPDPTAPQKLVPIRAGEDNRPIQDPVPLNGNGGRLPSDGDPVFLDFSFYPPQSFGALGLL